MWSSSGRDRADRAGVRVMTDEPIVFISRSRVRDGQVEALRTFFAAGALRLPAAKPRTLSLLAYLDERAETLTIVHVFADGAAMAAHMEGAGERSRAAGEFIDTTRMEIYGAPPAAILGAMTEISGSGVTVEVHPTHVPGFVRGEVAGPPFGSRPANDQHP
jgi:hypothetical protein